MSIRQIAPIRSYIKEKISRQYGALTGLGEIKMGVKNRAKLEWLDLRLNLLGRFHNRYLQVLGGFKSLFGRPQEFSYLPGEHLRVKWGKKRGAMEIKSMDGQALNYSPDLICFYNESHRFRKVNVTLLRELGYESTDLIGRSFETFIHPADVPMARERFASLMATQKSNPCEFRIRKKDGGYIWGWSIGRVLLEKGKKVGVAVHIRDITQRKELAVRQIVEQRRETLRLIWEGFYHEFNNAVEPLLQIGALAERMEEGKADTQTAIKILRKMEINTKRVAELSRRLQFFSGFSGLAKVRVNLVKLVNEMFNLMKEEFDREEITIIREYPSVRDGEFSEAFSLDLHFDGMQMVLKDLLRNAIEAICKRRADFMDSDRYEDYMTYRGKIKVSLRTEVQDEGQMLVLGIQDTGCGIEPEVQEEIFVPFFTTKLPGEGIGLGLTVVEQVIKEHDGTIHFESKPGRGTEITIRLPVSYTKK
jgi:PAS domain S-box-containing protein